MQKNVDDMAADGSMFVRTVLGFNNSFKSEDSCLALPSEDRLARARSAVDADADADGAQRWSRVEQQVQLILSRKAKRPTVMKGRNRGAEELKGFSKGTF